ncbi:TPA: hypothetical protein DD448_03615 [Candidatus Collierbacteria bacterium]|nr:hypothetical protein [Candidatus Collierbacteria bacterium]
MKIYFTSAISNVSPEVRGLYTKVIRILEDLGHTVIANHLQNKDEKVIESQTEKDALEIQSKMSKWKKQADLVVVEASTPSFGVGQEIAEALADNRQVVILFLKGKKPHVLVNQGQDSMYLVEYTPENLREQLTEYVDFAKANSDTRFNFFISPQIGSYLDWISRKKKLPRAVYLRRLIEDDMKLNKDYEEA